MIQFDVVTLFPGLFDGYLQQSLLAKAIQRGLVTVRRFDLRAWANDPHDRVDDRPYGGGPGMVLRAAPVVECVEEISRDQVSPGQVILLTPTGERLRQPRVQALAALPRIVLICGRYEGFDHRVSELLRPLELSLGDFVLNGGEVAAMAVMDAVIRFVPGVLGDERSPHEDSFANQGKLEFEQYTRPRVYRGLAVPEILLSGDHGSIARWREERSLARTRERDAQEPPGCDGEPPETRREGTEEEGPPFPSGGS